MAEMGVTTMRVIQHIWAFPVSLIGLFLGLFYGPTHSFIQHGVLYRPCKRLFPKKVQGQTWGEVVYYLPDYASDVLLCHEMVHVKQCRLLGPLMLVLYPLASLWAALQGKDCYRGNWFEKRAYEQSRRQ